MWFNSVMVADVYAHRKQVDVRQLYNEVPQTAWVSSSSRWSRMPAEWEPAPDWGLGPSVTHGWAVQPEYVRSAAMVRRTWGQYVAVCPRLQLTSHTQETSPFDWFGFFVLMAYQLFLCYLMPKPFSSKNSNGTMLPRAGRIRGFIPFPRVFARKWT